MASRITIDAKDLQQLQASGELQLNDSHGMPIVTITVGTRKEVQPIVYDSSDWTPEEIRSSTDAWLDDPAGWGAAGMDDYDKLYGDNPSKDES